MGEKKMNSTLQNIVSELDGVHKKIENLIHLTRRHFPKNITKSQRVQIEEQAYRDIWQHAEEIVYWFTYRNSTGYPSAMFMFNMKLEQLKHDGGINWILWSIDRMVRDFISLDRQFCALWPHWMRAQLRVMEAQAFSLSESIADFHGIGSHLSPLKYSKNRLNEQIVFSKKKCLKPSIVKKDLGLKDF